MKPHYHATVEHILLYGLSAILVINVVRIGAVKLAQRPGMLGTIGRSAGALVTFGG